ncbi:MAG: hypothetical protein ACI4RK_04390, partial [Oscillospiraceae bacterium]
MTRIDYFVLPWYKKLLVRFISFFIALGKGIAHFVTSIPGVLSRGLKKIGSGFVWFGKTFVNGDIYPDRRAVHHHAEVLCKRRYRRRSKG